jgi:putative ABC transport system permease protein
LTVRSEALRSAGAPWTATRLRAGPGFPLGLGVLVLLTAFLAAAFPRAVSAYEGDALRHTLDTAARDQSMINVSETVPTFLGDGTADEMVRPGYTSPRFARAMAALPAPLRAVRDQSSYGLHTVQQLGGADSWLPSPDGAPPLFTLTTQGELGSHSRLVKGRRPRADDDVTSHTRAVEGAVTTETAKALKIKVGSTVHIGASGAPGVVLAVRVTGIVTPVKPALSYWSAEPYLYKPSLFRESSTSGLGPRRWHSALLLPPTAGPAVLSITRDTEVFWHLAPDTSSLTASDIAGLAHVADSLEHGPAQTAMGKAVSSGVSVNTGLDTLLQALSSQLDAIGPVVAVAAFGVGTVAGVVLLMASGLAAARRHTELALLRARGASVHGIAGRLLAETAAPVLPAAALGYVLAVLTVHGDSLTPSVLAAAATALVAAGALPVRAALAHRRASLHEERDDLARARPSRRRTAAELTLLVLTVGAVVALRRRGTSDDGVDQLVSLAPVLVGLIAALVLGRLYPLPLRLASVPMAQRRGATGFLSLARAGRAGASAALPLLALLVALTTAAFGGSVLAGISTARDSVSLATVGADAAVSAVGTVPGALTAAVRKVPGVTDVAPVEEQNDLQLLDTGGHEGDAAGVTLLAVDPASYARLAGHTGRGAFSADALVRHGTSGPLPAVASPEVAARIGGAAIQIDEPNRSFEVKVAAVRAATPALPGGEYLLVNAAYLPGHKDTRLLVTGGSLDSVALRAAVREAGSDFTVRTRAQERAKITDSPAQTGAGRIYTVAVAAGAGYAVLALLLSLLQAAPERIAAMARLRMLGMTRRQGRRLLVLEALPQALLAAGGGALVGWAAIRLLAPGLDLSQVALSGGDSTEPVRLATDPWSLGLPAAAVVAVAVGVAAVQAWLATRQTANNQLRAGDPR